LFFIETDEAGRICQLFAMRNPEKLGEAERLGAGQPMIRRDDGG
jgi:hypothetical protein